MALLIKQKGTFLLLTLGDDSLFLLLWVFTRPGKIKYQISVLSLSLSELSTSGYSQQVVDVLPPCPTPPLAQPPASRCWCNYRPTATHLPSLVVSSRIKRLHWCTLAAKSPCSESPAGLTLFWPPLAKGNVPLDGHGVNSWRKAISCSLIN